MYLPERFRSLPMKSLYYGVLLAMVTTLSLSFVVFHAISDRMQKKSIDPAFDRIDEFELESSRGALNGGGPQALKVYLARLDRVFGGSSHYLLDARGIDMVTGGKPACAAASIPPHSLAHPRQWPLHPRPPIVGWAVLDLRRGPA